MRGEYAEREPRDKDGVADFEITYSAYVLVSYELMKK